MQMIPRARIPMAALALVLASIPALADKIKHPTAVFAGLDKITGRIIAFDVSTDETVQFGSLTVTPRVCYTRPQTEAPLTDGFVEVEEVTSTNEFKKIFSGWMFAASPGLHGVEHPVYDVWLTDCKGGTEVIRDVVALPQEDATPGPPAARRPPAAQPNQPRPNPSAVLSGPLPGAPGAPPLPSQPRTTGGLPQPLSPLPPAGNNVPPPPPIQAQPRNQGLVPPGNIPNTQTQAAPRRTPSQTFFPTQSQDRFRDP